jgi:hypothetical protein
MMLFAGIGVERMEGEARWKARFIGEAGPQAKGRRSEEVNPRRCVWSQCIVKL